MSGPVVRIRRVVVGAVDTNCWVVHAEGAREALLVDPGGDATAILGAVADLDVVAIVLTHTHFDHVLAVPAIREALEAPVLAHPAEAPVWPHELAGLARTGHWDAGTATAELLAAGRPLAPAAGRPPWNGALDATIEDGATLAVGPLKVQALHTPGHTPGGISLLAGAHLFSGDTLFPGGPGLTGWPLSDFPTIMTSVRRLLTLPADTLVHPGHGRDTTIGAERPAVEEWQARGW